MESTQLIARRRARHRPQWNGLVPEALFRRLSAEPVVGDSLCALGDALLSTADGRMLEFVALRSSAVRDCLYMWRGHCQIALRRLDEPITAEEIARIAAGPAAFTGADAAVVQAIDELLDDGCLSAPTRSALGDRALILTIATLFYETIAIVMHDAEPEAEPLDGLETPAAAARAVGR
jgi:alkylhydroperoxidase family enzyme